jgi:hypothetical protein
MGSQPYYYFCSYQEDFDTALQNLRQNEFEAGRYNPAMYELDLSMSSFAFPPGSNSASPGAKHSSIEEAFKAGGPEGTGSILDVQRISETPEFMASALLPPEFLLRFFKTEKPTRELVESVIIREEVLDDDDLDSLDAWDDFADLVETPGGCHFIVYAGDQPSEIFFMGYVIG